MASPHLFTVDGGSPLTAIQRRIERTTAALAIEVDGLRDVSNALEAARAVLPPRRWQEERAARRPREHRPLPPYIKRRTREIIGVVERVHGGPLAVEDRLSIKWPKIAALMKLDDELDGRRRPSMEVRASTGLLGCGHECV